MTLSRILQIFSPKNTVFFGLFEQAVENLVIMNQLFIEAINSIDKPQRNDIIKQIKDYEHKNDDITHKIFTELSRNFITPFDREDIHTLASALDDIADYIDGSSKKIMLYNITKIGDDIHQLASINGEAINEVRNAVYELRNLNNVSKIKEACVKINKLENKADDIFEIGLSNLLENEKEAATIIKTKDLLQSMEFVSDKCEDVADVIQTIVVKYA